MAQHTEDHDMENAGSSTTNLALRSSSTANAPGDNKTTTTTTQAETTSSSADSDSDDAREDIDEQEIYGRRARGPSMALTFGSPRA